MFTAKLIRHRWEYQQILNGRVNYIEHEDHFKVVFSHPEEYNLFNKWCYENGGSYDWDRAKNKQVGDLPTKAKELFFEDVGWCDLITYYLLHVAGYSFHSVIADVAFKGEVYTKEERGAMTQPELFLKNKQKEIEKESTTFETDKVAKKPDQP